jgi:hypothetical protein
MAALGAFMDMSDILQKNEFLRIFEKPVNFKQFGIESIDQLIKDEPSMFFEIGGHVWMRYLESSKKNSNTKKFEDDFSSCNPLVFKKIEKLIKKKIIYDLCFSYAYVNDQELMTRQCCQLLLFRLWPNEIFIADVAFSDPYNPVPSNAQKYKYHEFRSLGLFSLHLDLINKYCKENKIDRISLSTASNDQIPYFEKYGFSLYDNAVARIGKSVGMGAPMWKKPT